LLRCSERSKRDQSCLPIFHNHYQNTTTFRYPDDGLAEL